MRIYKLEAELIMSSPDADYEDAKKYNGSLSHIIWASLNEANGLALTIVSIALSIFTGYVNSLENGLIIFCALVLIIIIWSLYKTSDKFIL